MSWTDRLAPYCRGSPAGGPAPAPSRSAERWAALLAASCHAAAPTSAAADHSAPAVVADDRRAVVSEADLAFWRCSAEEVRRVRRLYMIFGNDLEGMLEAERLGRVLGAIEATGNLEGPEALRELTRAEFHRRTACGPR